MEPRTFVNTSAVAIGGITLFFAGWALLDPESLAAKMGVSTEHATWLGYRDLVSAGLLLTRRDAPAFGVRAAADVMDAITMARTRPTIALGAAAFAGLSVAAGVAAWQART